MSKNTLREFLKIIPVADEKIDRIVAECNGNIDNFFDNANRWHQFDLNKEEIVTILKMKNAYQRARMDCESYSTLTSYFPDTYLNDEENFYKEFQDRIDDEPDEPEKSKLRKIYRLAFTTGVNLAAHISVFSTGFIGGFTGAVIGSLIFPGIGTFFGGVTGSTLGGFLGMKYVKPEIKKLFQDQNVKLDDKKVESLYDEALEKLNVTRETDTKAIQELRRAYLLANHPNKQNNENSVNKLIELERYFQTIKRYREAKNTW